MTNIFDDIKFNMRLNDKELTIEATKEFNNKLYGAKVYENIDEINIKDAIYKMINSINEKIIESE